MTTVKQFIKHVEDRIQEGYWDREYDLIHVGPWKDLDLSKVKIHKQTRSGSGFVYPDSIYYEPDSGKFVELITLED